VGDGPPVVLLHGLTCHLGYWQRVIPLLEGLRVVALDFGGHGLSAHRDSYPYVAYQRDLLGLAGVRCLAHVIAGSQSNVMPPDKARPFAEAMPAGALELVPGAGHHVELEAADLIAARILELTRDG
jgi:pimeloyl-ACP methyl ester carboxylesterase